MKDERKQTNRNVEQNRSSGPKRTTDNKRDEQLKGFVDWDDESYQEITRLRSRIGRFTERYFERDED